MIKRVVIHFQCQSKMRTSIPPFNYKYEIYETFQSPYKLDVIKEQPLLAQTSNKSSLHIFIIKNTTEYYNDWMASLFLAYSTSVTQKFLSTSTCKPRTPKLLGWRKIVVFSVGLK